MEVSWLGNELWKRDWARAEKKDYRKRQKELETSFEKEMQLHICERKF